MCFWNTEVFMASSDVINPGGTPRARKVALVLGGAVVIAAGAGAVLTVSGEVTRSPVMGDFMVVTQPMTQQLATQVQPDKAVTVPVPGGMLAPSLEYKPVATTTQPACKVTPGAATQQVLKGDMAVFSEIEWKAATTEPAALPKDGKGETKP
jgi:hypothetical protein